MHHLRIKKILLTIVVLFVGIEGAWAEDFRLENRVYLEGKKEPESRTVTLFHGGMVYDFLSDPGEVTIFDKATGRFILLNMANREQTELTVAELKAFTEKLKQSAGKQKDPVYKFFADPKFEERFDSLNEELTFTSPTVTYAIKTKAVKNATICGQYREFSDGYSQLNAMLNPGSRPPQARLQINEALSRRGILPEEVKLTITSMKDNSPQKTVLRSEHEFKPGLTESDLDRIKQVGEARGKFKAISFDKYGKNRKP
jgi:hypothetical protein